MNEMRNRKEPNWATVDLSRASAQDRLFYASFIKNMRKAAGLTQDELGDAAASTGRTIRNMETGHTAPQADILARVMRVLGVELEKQTWSEPTAQYMSILGPLIESLDENNLVRTMNKVILVLANAIKEQVPMSQPASNVTSINRRVEDMSVEEIEELRSAANRDTTEPDEFPEG